MSSKIVQICANFLLRTNHVILAEQRREFNANRAMVTKIKRNLFARLYPATLVNPDGSTIRIKYQYPRGIVKMPLDFDKLDSSMQKKVRLMRQPREDANKKQDTVTVAFDPMKYAK
jgi:large subunit ribosomal protein L55